MGNLLVGVIGALLGAFIFEVLGITAWGLAGRLIVATVGAVLLLRFIKA